MVKNSWLLLIGIFLLSNGYTQTNKYFIAFKNKNGTPYSISNSSAFLSAKAIQRRINQGIAVNYSDLPVTPSYVSQIASVPSVTILHRIKWLNGVLIQATNPTATTVIQTYSFVQATQPINLVVNSSPKNQEVANNSITYSSTQKIYGYNYGGATTQNNMINISCLHNNGYRGQNMTIAVIDDGFYNVNNNPVFDSLFLENRLLGTRDFVSRDTMVFEDDYHGAYVLSTMAACSPGNIIGTAPKAKYWLLRSEDVASETPAEEYYWVRAAEFADSVGADVIASSLGYTTFDNATYNHTYAMMNGKTTPIAKAAVFAARKGMFVTIAAGNEGAGTWYYISTPADADSVCTVGAVDNSLNVASFSSKGPTSDGRIKPDVCAMGVLTAVSDANGNVFNGNGTSFATPIIAGAVTCLWQSKPTLHVQQLLQLVKQVSTNYASPNNNIGYGVPNFCSAYSIASVELFNSSTKVNIFPNPASNILHIQSSNKILSAIIKDIAGNTIAEYSIKENFTETDISSLSQGIYFIVIQTETSELQYKFIKL